MLTKYLLPAMIAFFAVPVVFSQSEGGKIDPKAAEILDRNEAAVAPPEVLKQVVSMFIISRVKLPDGVVGSSVMKVKRGGKLLKANKIERPGMRLEAKEGCDGVDCYSADPQMGSRLVEGQEKELMMAGGFLSPPWRSVYKAAYYKGSVAIEGRNVHRIEVESKEGMKATFYIDDETSMIRRQEIEVQRPLGKMKSRIDFFEYADKDGYKYASRSIATIMSITIESTVEQIEINVEIPDSVFKLPAGLK